MNSDTLEPTLITFMYFIHRQGNDDNMTPELFYEKWSSYFYDFEDMSSGKYYE